MTTAVEDQQTDDDKQGDSPVLADQGDDAPEEKAAADRLLKDDGSPYTKADIDALNEALKKARRDARQARRGKPETEGDDGEDAVKAIEQAQASKWKPLIVKAQARTMFTEAGLAAGDGAMDRVLRMLDLEDLDVNDDGQVDGLREQIEDIRADVPQLFTTARQRAPRADVGDKGNGAPARKKDAAELIVERLRGGVG